jgi:hypothetical protein
MNLAKNIAGWVLLILGVVLIGWVLLSTYNIFTGKIAAPEIFDSRTEDVLNKKTSATQSGDGQAQIEKIMGEQIGNLVPPGALSKILNMTVWSVLAWVFISGGAQLSGIGIKLMSKQ